jgi:hypothetical protein
MQRFVLFNQFRISNKFHQYIFFERTSFFQPISKDHQSETILDAILPSAFIDTAISPSHLTKSSFYIIFVLTLICASGCPLKLTVALLHIIMVLALVLVCVFLDIGSLFPNTFALLFTCFEHTRVRVAISPPILPASFCCAILILTKIDVAVIEYIGALAVSE